MQRHGEANPECLIQCGRILPKTGTSYSSLSSLSQTSQHDVGPSSAALTTTCPNKHAFLPSVYEVNP